MFTWLEFGIQVLKVFTRLEVSIQVLKVFTWLEVSTQQTGVKNVHLAGGQHTGVQSVLTTVEFALHQRLSDHEEDCVQYDHSDVCLSAPVNKTTSDAAFSPLTYKHTIICTINVHVIYQSVIA